MKSRTRWSLVRWVSTVVMAWLLLPMMLGAESRPKTGFASSDVCVDLENIPVRIPARAAQRVGPGTPMCVTLEDSTELRGIYLGRSQFDDDAYRARLEAWRRAMPGAPEIGGPVDLVHGDASMERVTFLGFSYRAVEVRREPPGGRVRVPFSHFRILRVLDGREWTTDTLAILDARGKLPSREALQIGQAPHRDWGEHTRFGIGEAPAVAFGDTALVPLDAVRWVEVPTKQPASSVAGGGPSSSSDAAIGVVVGLAVGAILVIAIVAASQPHVETTQCESTGTPFMWSRTAEPGTLDFDTRAGTYVEPAVADSARGIGGASDADLALRGAR